MRTVNACFGLLLASLDILQVSGSKHGFNHFPSLQKERARRAVNGASVDKLLESRQANYRYYCENTKPYFIESWPLVNFDTGEFYSGSVPIDESDPSRTLFFIFKPATDAPSNDLTIWLNGGPGCSSLVGFFQENGKSDRWGEWLP